MRLDAPESCSMYCTHHGPGTCDPCNLVFYPLSPDLMVEKCARFVGVCEECAGLEYVSVMPANARMAGEVNA